MAADAAVGGDKSYSGSVPVTILKVVGIELTSIGRFEPSSQHEEVIALDHEIAKRYRMLVIGQDGRIAGAILLGYSREVGDHPGPRQRARGQTWSVRVGRDHRAAGFEISTVLSARTRSAAARARRAVRTRQSRAC